MVHVGGSGRARNHLFILPARGWKCTSTALDRGIEYGNATAVLVKHLVALRHIVTDYDSCGLNLLFGELFSSMHTHGIRSPTTLTPCWISLAANYKRVF